MTSIPDVPDASAALLADLRALLGPLPPWAGSVIELAEELVLLAMLAAWLRLSLLARDAGVRVRARLVAVPSGAVLAWGAAEQVRQVDRPCRLLPSFPGWADCAAPGDCSLRRNHAAVAGALTVGVALAAWRQRRPGLLMIALVTGPCGAVSRVLAGAHSPHDVAVGAALGGIVAFVSLVATDLLAPRLPGQGHPRRRDGQPVGPAHGLGGSGR